MKIILYSLNPEEYPDIEMEFEECEMKDVLSKTTGELIKAKKTAVVQAQKLEEDTIVDTRVRVEVGGRLYTFTETVNKATAGSWVITNPDGEQYVIKDKVKDGKVTTADSIFESKYERVSGGYVSKEGEKPFVVAKSNICFPASWGELQFVTAGSVICTAYGEEDLYGVTNSAFDSTYVKTEDQSDM